MSQNEADRVALRLGNLAELVSAAVGPIVGETAIDLIQQGFEDEKDPYGNDWELIQRKGRILRDRGLLYRSWRWLARPGEIEVSSGQAYAKFHQEGTKHMVPRKMFPDDDLPLEWQTSIDEAIEAGIEQAMQEELSK